MNLISPRHSPSHDQVLVFTMQYLFCFNGYDCLRWLYIAQQLNLQNKPPNKANHENYQISEHTVKEGVLLCTGLACPVTTERICVTVFAPHNEVIHVRHRERHTQTRNLEGQLCLSKLQLKIFRRPPQIPRN